MENQLNSPFDGTQRDGNRVGRKRKYDTGKTQKQQAQQQKK
jgi:hypothetical protein